MNLHPVGPADCCVPRWKRASLLACWLLCRLAGILAATASIGHGAEPPYEEAMTLRWGQVVRPDNGQKVSLWYSDRLPLFNRPGAFTAEQQQALQQAFRRLAADRDGNTVYRLTRPLLNDVALTLQQNGVFSEIQFETTKLPAPWQPGNPAQQSWTLRFRYTASPTPSPETEAQPPPAVEIFLRCERIPPQTAVPLVLEAVLADPAIRERSGLPASRLAELATCAGWLQIFLVPPEPGVKVTNTLAAAPPREYATPAAFALRLLDQLEPALRADRRFTPQRQTELTRALNPPPSGTLRDAEPYFPELCYAELGNPEMSSIEPGGVRVGFSQAGAQASASSRVTGSWNVWWIDAGPFRWFAQPRVVVDRVKGAKQLYTLAQLEAKLADRPGAFERYLEELALTTTNLQGLADSLLKDVEGYFWLPTIQRANLEALRALRAERFVHSVTPRIGPEGLVYDAVYTYSPLEGEVGASYDATHELGASAKINWNRVFHASDSLYVDGTLTMNSIEGQAGYRLVFTESLDRLTRQTLNPYGRAERDERFRLGSLSDTPFDLTAYAAGASHELFHQGGAWSVTFRQDAHWQSFDLDNDAVNPTPPPQSGLLLEHRQTWKLTPGDSSGEARSSWEFALQPSVSYGPEAGWERSFWMVEAQLAARVRFGGETHRAMHASLRTGFGTSSEGIPEAALYRSGDVNRLLGLEPGEYSGRSYTHLEGTYGVQLDFLLGGLFRSPTNQTDTAVAGGTAGAEAGEEEETPSQALAILQALSLDVIAELGTVDESSSTDVFTDPESLLSSFGVALAVDPSLLGGGVGFRLGYAYSPDSLRTSGRVFAALTWNF